jgi:hypothetical protein
MRSGRPSDPGAKRGAAEKPPLSTGLAAGLIPAEFGRSLSMPTVNPPNLAYSLIVNPKDIALKGLDKALDVNQAVVQRHIARMRASRPNAQPGEIIKSFEKQFMSAVTTLGAAAGASAAVPGVTTGPAIAVNLAEVASFMEAAVLFALSVAGVHGVQVDDVERRRTLIMAVLMGSSGAGIVEKAAGRTAPYWGRTFVKAMPMSTINKVNKVLGPRFVTKYGTKQGILVLGREIPLGLGAIIGGGGNALLARAAIGGARRAFGPPPTAWPALIGGLGA